MPLCILISKLMDSRFSLIKAYLNVRPSILDTQKDLLIDETSPIRANRYAPYGAFSPIFLDDQRY